MDRKAILTLNHEEKIKSDCSDGRVGAHNRTCFAIRILEHFRDRSIQPSPPPNHPIWSGSCGWLGGGEGWLRVNLNGKRSSGMLSTNDSRSFSKKSRPALGFLGIFFDGIGNQVKWTYH